MKKLYETVFEDASGYFRARIPGIVSTEKGTVIAYCELRKSDSDWAVIDIGMRKSTDNGKTFGERKILVSGGNENTVNNPVMIADGDTLHFVYCINYRRVFYMKSTDEGESWTSPREITPVIKNGEDEFFWSCVATGPCHGIKTSSGRLIVPMWLAVNHDDPKSHHPSVICVFYSDDDGENWKTGEICNSLRDGSEFLVAETAGGLKANIRHEEAVRYRAVAEIDGQCRIRNIRFAENLPDPVCCAGFAGAGDRLVFSNCDSVSGRKNLTVKKLDEDFMTLDSLLINESGGYSDVALSFDEKTAYILYECEKILICAAVSI